MRSIAQHWANLAVTPLAVVVGSWLIPAVAGPLLVGQEGRWHAFGVSAQAAFGHVSVHVDALLMLVSVAVALTSSAAITVWQRRRRVSASGRQDLGQG